MFNERVTRQNLLHFRLGPHGPSSIREGRKELSQRIRESGTLGTIRKSPIVVLVCLCRACRTIGMLRSSPLSEG